MIFLEKGEIPKVLADNAAKWLAELKKEIAAGGKKVEYRKSKYNTKGIKDKIEQETHGKCAYCEAKLLHITYGDIEHIIPKSEDIDLTFLWSNLTMSCDKCNTNKGEKMGIFDPYGSDPEIEFQFYGPMISHRPGRHIAENTHIELQLNRVQLLERRHEAAKALATNLERLANIADAGERELLRNAIIAQESSREREFSACLKSLIEIKRQQGQI
ncbi:MAG: hypothetical protein EOR60_01820 [Mesorhizobium sp.]|nr:MAG: hypothetical protein EOR60_01820 [Mesorhizobium sp.]